MSTTDTLEASAPAPEQVAPSEGFAGQAVRFERRLGWVLWSALAVLLVVLSF